MARNLLALLDNLLVTDVVGNRPSGPTDGVGIPNWRTNGSFVGPSATVLLEGTAAASVTSPTGGTAGVEFWGYLASESGWFLIGYLNNGNAVPIVGAAQGFAQKLDVIGVFDRLAVAGTPSTGTVTAKLVPIEEWLL